MGRGKGRELALFTITTRAWIVRKEQINSKENAYTPPPPRRINAGGYHAGECSTTAAVAIVVGMTVIGTLGISGFAAAETGRDPTVDDLRFIRTVNQTWVGPPATYDYVWETDVCNVGNVDYFTNAWSILTGAFNSGDPDGGVEEFSDLYNDNLLAGCLIEDTITIVREGVWNQSEFYCCGYAQFIHAIGGDNDNPNNNKLTDNIHQMALFAGQSDTSVIAVINLDEEEREFDHSVVGVPEGWSFSLSEQSTIVDADEVGYFELSITAPSTVTVWPDVVVSSTVSDNHFLDQETTVKVRDDGTYNDECTGV